jgi:cobalt-zinc-cadmium efflux system outer membrane protein
VFREYVTKFPTLHPASTRNNFGRHPLAVHPAETGQDAASKPAGRSRQTEAKRFARYSWKSRSMKRVRAYCRLRCGRGAGWRVACAALLAAALVVSMAGGQLLDDRAVLPAPTSATSVALAELEQMALANNPTLAVASANVSAARGRQIQGGLRPNPKIGYMADDIGEDDTAGEHNGFISQEFVTGGKLRLNRAVGAREVQERQLLFDAQQLRVLSDVRLRFYDALVAQRQVEMSDELARLSRQSSDASRQLFEGQQISQSDLLQAQIDAEEAQITAHHARFRHAEARRRLAAVVGIDELELAPLGGNLEEDIPIYGWEETYARVLAQNPTLAAAQMRVERARLALARARRENVPNVEVMASVGRRYQTDDGVAGVQVGIPLPICNRNQGNILTADAELIAAQNDSRRIELQLQDRLATAYRRYADAREQVERYRAQILPRAQQAWDLVGRGYREGQVDFLVLLTSQRTYTRVNLMYVEALAELRQAVTLIDGMLLSDSLQTE